MPRIIFYFVLEALCFLMQTLLRAYDNRNDVKKETSAITSADVVVCAERANADEFYTSSHQSAFHGLGFPKLSQPGGYCQ